MKILTFDDKPDVIYYLEEYFNDGNYDITTCDTCSDAIQVLKEGCFDCYIVDLNAATAGLPDEFERKTQNGLLTGWFLLTKYIWKNDEKEIAKTIIFSDYITQLQHYLKSEKASADEKENFWQLEKHGHIVSKSEGLEQLENAIITINNRNGSK